MAATYKRLKQEQDELANLESGASSGAPLEMKKNKQRVLVLASRGITQRYRHLMEDVLTLLPHSVKESKFDQKHDLPLINELCEARNCNNCIFFETRKHKDLYLWLAKTPNGPSVKFLVENVHTMAELKFTGNYLRGSRPFLCFDASFDGEPFLQVMKEMFIQTFGVPSGHRAAKPFHDHVISFFYLDGRVWLRHYQVLDANPSTKVAEAALVEIGPRLALQPIRIFGSSFRGRVIFSNAEYTSPNEVRSQAKRVGGAKYKSRVVQAEKYKRRIEEKPPVQPNPLDDVFGNRLA